MRELHYVTVSRPHSPTTIYYKIPDAAVVTSRMPGIIEGLFLGAMLVRDFEMKLARLPPSPRAVF